MKVGIQGVLASFHDVAARKFFSERSETIEPVECRSFKKLCELLATKKTEYSLMAIENTIAGSILTNYSLMERYRFKIVGEVYLRIELNLMALPGQTIGDLKFIQSHPMALFQCEEFLFKNPHCKALEADDTAESAKEIAEKKLRGYGAIAHRLAAERYGLEVLEEGIETTKLNYTRFLVICREEDYQPGKDSDKASLRFETPNRPGGLVEILEIFRNHQINMTKIQSVPILGKPYEYSIHVDLDWTEQKNYLRSLADLEKRAGNLLHFGEYKKGRRADQ